MRMIKTPFKSPEHFEIQDRVTHDHWIWADSDGDFYVIGFEKNDVTYLPRNWDFV